jgi:hypothetical protein
MYWEHDATMEARRDRWEDPDIGGWKQRMDEGWEFVDEMIEGAPYDETRPTCPCTIRATPSASP